MKREYLYFGAIIILAILIFIALFNNKAKTTSSNIKNTTTTKTSNSKTIPNGQIGIVKHNYDGYGSVDVYIKNNTEKTIDRVIITCESWDKNGNNLGTHKAFQRNVNTKDTYKITVYCSTEMKKYNLKLDYE